MAGREKKLELTDDEWDVVVCNLGLVRCIAREVAAKASIRGQEVDAMFSAGTIGLAKAVARCVAERGTLAAVAGWWIRDAIDSHREGSRTIHVPAYLTRPSAADHPYRKFADRAAATLASDAGDDFDLDRRPDDRRGAEKAEFLEALRSAMVALPECERRVIESRLRGETHKAIAVRHAVSRDRIRGVERRAHEKLRVMLADYA